MSRYLLRIVRGGLFGVASGGVVVVATALVWWLWRRIFI